MAKRKPTKKNNSKMNSQSTDVAPIILENGYNKMEVMAKIIERMIDGQSLRSICRDESMPNKSTVLRWLNEDDGELATSIAHARELMADAMNDDISEIVNKTVEGLIDPQAARVAIWAKQWQAAKMRPKKYGEKVAHDHTGKVEVIDKSNLLTLEEATAAHRKFLESLRIH